MKAVAPRAQHPQLTRPAEVSRELLRQDTREAHAHARMRYRELSHGILDSDLVRLSPFQAIIDGASEARFRAGDLELRPQGDF